MSDLSHELGLDAVAGAKLVPFDQGRPPFDGLPHKVLESFAIPAWVKA